MKTRWKILLTVVIAVPALAGIWLLSMHYQSTSELEAYKQQLRAQGEKLEVSELVPPSPSPEDNGADLASSGLQLLTNDLSDLFKYSPPKMRLITPGRAMVGSMQPDARNDEATNTWEQVAAALAAERPGMELIKEAAACPTIDFRLDYQDGFKLEWKPYGRLRHADLRLAEEAMCALHAGAPATAVTNVCLLLRLIQDEQNGHLIITELTRQRMEDTAAAVSWELLQTPQVTGAELAKLQAAWQPLEFIAPMEKAFELQRAETLLQIEQIRNSTPKHLMPLAYSGASLTGWSGWLNDPLGHLKDEWDRAKLEAATQLWCNSWSYADELRILQYDQLVLNILRPAITNVALFPASTDLARKTKAWQAANPAGGGSTLRLLGLRPARGMFSSWVTDFQFQDLLIASPMAAEAARQIAVTAIALKRFQLESGHWPETLAELSPKFLPEVPLDPVDGRPLRYRRNADGTFLLYSIGSNGVDDGGDPTAPAGTADDSLYWLAPDARDWVWPQPATAAEMEAFHQKQAKGK